MAFFVIEDSFKRQIASFHVILVVYFERERGGDIMTTKKDLIIVILATFCLTLTLFTILPTHSSSSTATLEYDPWKDIDGDGKITLYDAVSLLNSYGAQGDPTRNVTVTNWPPFTSDYTYGPIALGPSASTYSQSFQTAGYAQFVVSASADSVGAVVTVTEINDVNSATLDTWPIIDWFSPSKAYPVTTPYIFVSITNTNPKYLNYTIQVQFEVQLTTSTYTETQQTYNTGRVNDVISAESYNISWASGQNEAGTGGFLNFAGGFSRMYLSFKMTDASKNFSGANLFIHLSMVEFTDGRAVGYKSIQMYDSAVLNMTITDWTGSSEASSYFNSMAEPIVVKGPYFYANLDATGLQSIAPSGWVIVNAYYYLRNE